MDGNLTSRDDTVNSVNETFTYDALNRVLTDNISGGTSKSFAYDATGDISSKSDVGTYAYPSAGSARPHGVTAITGTVNNGAGSAGVVTNPTYGYDGNGNLTSGGGRTFAYTSFNRPSCMSNASGAACPTSSASALHLYYDSERQRP